MIPPTYPDVQSVEEVSYHATIHDLPSDERPRERIARFGPSTLQTTELLAIILRTGTTKMNVIELARHLLTTFQGLDGLLRADFAEVCKIHGMAEAKTAQLKAALELGRRLKELQPHDRPKISSAIDVFHLVGIEMTSLVQEQLRVILLDSKNAVLSVETIYQGTVNSSHVRIAEVLRPAVTRTCPSIIITHNHPSGDVTPSREDQLVTERIFEAAKLFDIKLLDHIIIGQGRHLSMREHHLGFPEENGAK